MKIRLYLRIISKITHEIEIRFVLDILILNEYFAGNDLSLSPLTKTLCAIGHKMQATS